VLEDTAFRRLAGRSDGAGTPCAVFSFGVVEFLLARDGVDAADTLAGASLLLNAILAYADA
jgi:hypothetical protein